MGKAPGRCFSAFTIFRPAISFFRHFLRGFFYAHFITLHYFVLTLISYGSGSLYGYWTLEEVLKPLLFEILQTEADGAVILIRQVASPLNGGQTCGSRSFIPIEIFQRGWILHHPQLDDSADLQRVRAFDIGAAF